MSEEKKDIILKPCPFCGSAADLRDDSDSVTMDGPQCWWICCSCCSANVDGFYTAEDAAYDWNLRITID
jgi:Lar family restriction alleviation protein